VCVGVVLVTVVAVTGIRLFGGEFFQPGFIILMLAVFIGRL
jgi:hypothetical protein